MQQMLWVGTGGFVGAIMRYVLGSYVQNLSKTTAFPYGTFAVNIIGCVGIGLLSHLADTNEWFRVELRLLLITGIMGGFTTFSTLSNETLHLLRNGMMGLAVLNMGGQVVLGLGAVWCGYAVAQALLS